MPLSSQGMPPEGLVPGMLRLAGLLDLLGGDPDFFQRIVNLADRVMHDPDDAPVQALGRAGQEFPVFGRLLLDRIIPALARRLGDEWERDALSFTEVTIAAARLQKLTRHLEPPVGRTVCGTIALIVPPWEQHTLPGMLLAHEIRRRDVAVRHCIGLDAEVVARMSETGATQGFLVSVGSIQSLERLPNYLRQLRRRLTCVRPIVVGGPGIVDIAARPDGYGADRFANGAAEALAFCDLSLSNRPSIGEHPGWGGGHE